MKPTGIALDTLKHVGNVFSAAPGGDFKVHGGKKKMILPQHLRLLQAVAIFVAMTTRKKIGDSISIQSCQFYYLCSKIIYFLISNC